MNQSIDQFCVDLARSAGVDPQVSTPEIPEGIGSSFDDIPASRMLRLVDIGRMQVVVMTVPPDFRQSSRRVKTASEAAQDIGRALSYLCYAGLPKRQWGRIGVVILEDGWQQPNVISSCLDSDPNGIMKFGLRTGEDTDSLVDRLPALARLWEAREVASPDWLSRLSAPDGMDPFSVVDIELEQGPGLTVLKGGNGTGKTYLISSALSAMTRGSGPLVAEFVNDRRPSVDAATLPSRKGNEVDDEALQPFRKLMGYGDPDGRLFMPIEYEGNSAQAMEVIGRNLMASATTPDGNWPGLMLDTPLQGMDEIRACKMIETVVRLAGSRQVIVSSRGSDVGTWKFIAEEWGVPCGIVELNGNEAVLKRRYKMEPDSSLASGPCP